MQKKPRILVQASPHAHVADYSAFEISNPSTVPASDRSEDRSEKSQLIFKSLEFNKGKSN